jgi:hypothetical protein
MGAKGRFPTQKEAEEDNKMEVEPHEEGMYVRCRHKDHLIGVHFECDLCYFHNLTLRDPIWGNTWDEY